MMRAELRNGAQARHRLFANTIPGREKSGTRCRIVRVYAHSVRVKFLEGPAAGQIQSVHPDDLVVTK